MRPTGELEQQAEEHRRNASWKRALGSTAVANGGFLAAESLVRTPTVRGLFVGVVGAAVASLGIGGLSGSSSESRRADVIDAELFRRDAEIAASKLHKFVVDGESKSVQYIETLPVKDGVECDTYVFVDDPSKDLAIVRVKAGSKTPLQKVLSGKRTVEGLVSGKGNLTITPPTPELVQVRTFDSEGSASNTEVEVAVGDTMQWYAETDLVFYEICEPPYVEGRFEDLVE